MKRLLLGLANLTAIIALGLAGIIVLIAMASLARADTGKVPYEDRIMNRVNHARIVRDLQPLAFDSKADAWAEAHVLRIASGTWAAHSDMSDFLDFANAQGVGEVMARGHMKPRTVVRMWLDSPSHRAVILNPRYEGIGVGAVNRRGVWYVVADVLWR